MENDVLYNRIMNVVHEEYGPPGEGTKEITITENGTITEDVKSYASAEITTAVPNSYTESDEGKVVSSGALVSQSSATYTTNDTYDTTLISEVIVNVSGGSSDPYHLKAGQELTFSIGATDYVNSKACLTELTNRMSIVATSGSSSSELYYVNENILSERYLIPIPTGAIKVTIAINADGDLAVREFTETGGVISSSIATTSWLSVNKNTPTEVTLTSGTNYIGISLRVNSSNTSYTNKTQPFAASVDFS